jgi:hypothetical protein
MDWTFLILMVVMAIGILIETDSTRKYVGRMIVMWVFIGMLLGIGRRLSELE